MKRNVLGVMTAIAAIAASAPAAQAQNPMTFGIAAGASIPMGDLADNDLFSAKTGWHGMATLGFMPTMLPFGMRIDGMYNSMSLEGGGDASYRIIGANANAIIAMPATVASPYLIGGVGMYNQKIDSDDIDIDGETDFGINVGIGTKFNLSGFGTFAEIRYHNIFSEGSSTQFLPITFGIMF